MQTAQAVVSVLVPWGCEARILSHCSGTGSLPHPNSPSHIAFMLHLYPLSSHYLSLEEEESCWETLPHGYSGAEI